MHFCDSKGNIVGFSDVKDPHRIILINPDKFLRIKQIVAHNNMFNYFYFKYDNGEELHISMKNIVEDGRKENGDYVYQI